MPHSPVILQANNLVKNFGAFAAVQDISLSIKKGEILGFLGPNGAGKSTTMRMLTGALLPTSGEVLLDGQDIREGGASVRAKIGYLPEGAPLYPDMTVKEYLYFIAACHKITGDEAVDVITSAANAVNLTYVMDQIISTLSKGYCRRVGLAGSILHAPDLLILDEPTDGLDPNQKFEVRKLIETMALERAIIISTHILEEVDALCTRTLVINEGQVVADALPSELKAMSKYEGAVTMVVEHGQAEKIAASLSQMRVIESIDAMREGDGMRLTVFGQGGEEIASRISDMASISNWGVNNFTVEIGRLDDVFRTLTTRDPAVIKQAVDAFLSHHRGDAK